MPKPLRIVNHMSKVVRSLCGKSALKSYLPDQGGLRCCGGYRAVGFPDPSRRTRQCRRRATPTAGKEEISEMQGLLEGARPGCASTAGSR